MYGTRRNQLNKKQYLKVLIRAYVRIYAKFRLQFYTFLLRERQDVSKQFFTVPYAIESFMHLQSSTYYFNLLLSKNDIHILQFLLLFILHWYDQQACSTSFQGISTTWKHHSLSINNKTFLFCFTFRFVLITIESHLFILNFFTNFTHIYKNIKQKQLVSLEVILFEIF